MSSLVTSSWFHMFIDIKRQLADYKVAFSKPHCLCLTTLAKHTSFWHTCADAFDYLDQLASLALQYLCDTHQCTCLEEPQTVQCFDALFALAKSFLFALGPYKHHQSTGQTLTLLEDDQLAYHLDSVAKKAHRYTNKLLRILEKCSVGHAALLDQYNTCPMEE